MKEQIVCDFKTLKQPYLEVRALVEKKACAPVKSSDTKIEEDLGCAGDDNLELLEEFVERYKLDATGFDYSKHFLSEGELFDSGAVLFKLFLLPIQIILWSIYSLTLGRIDFTKVVRFRGTHRKTLDMTFGDLLAWRLAGRYCLRADVRFQLQSAR